MQVGILENLLLLVMVFAAKSQNLIKVQVGKFLKINKVCCTVIRETKVVSKTTVALNRVMKTGEHAS